MLSRCMGWLHVDISEFAVERGLVKGYDEERRTHIADIRGIRRAVEGLKPPGAVVLLDGHIAHLVASGQSVLGVVVLRCAPLELAERLRGWAVKKVAENVQSEVLGVCASEAASAFKRVCEVDTTGRSPEEVCREVVELYGEGFPRRVGLLDWMRSPDEEVLRWMRIDP